MRVIRLSLQFAAFIMLFIFLACASTSTKFSTSWKDESYKGYPERILVINLSPNPMYRRFFEDEFVMALRDRRVEAVESYRFMPDPIVYDENFIANDESLRRCLQEVGANTVLINKPLGRTTNEVIGAGGGRVFTNLDIDTQTDVYDMTSNKLVWSATAKTRIQEGTSYDTGIKSFIKDLVQKMSSQQGLF